MSGRNMAAFGIYGSELSAVEAADSLIRIGFRDADIAILLQRNSGSKDFGHEKHTKASAMAAAGATIGAVIAGALGWLVSIGAFGVIPWLAPFLAPEPAGTVLSAVGAGSVLGLLAGALLGAEIPTYEARRYDGRIRHGGILLSAHCDNRDWTKRAEDILRETGAKRIGIRAEARADFGSSRKPLPRTRTAEILDYQRASGDAFSSIPRNLDPGEINSTDENLHAARRFSSES